MEKQSYLSQELIREIARYLAAVDLFRAERCEPTWLPEPMQYSYPENSVRTHAGQVHATH